MNVLRVISAINHEVSNHYLDSNVRPSDTVGTPRPNLGLLSLLNLSRQYCLLILTDRQTETDKLVERHRQRDRKTKRQRDRE